MQIPYTDECISAEWQCLVFSATEQWDHFSARDLIRTTVFVGMRLYRCASTVGINHSSVGYSKTRNTLKDGLGTLTTGVGILIVKGSTTHDVCRFMSSRHVPEHHGVFCTPMGDNYLNRNILHEEDARI